jgi:hypothetical protein
MEKSGKVRKSRKSRKKSTSSFSALCKNRCPNKLMAGSKHVDTATYSFFQSTLFKKSKFELVPQQEPHTLSYPGNLANNGWSEGSCQLGWPSDRKVKA